MRLIVLAFSLLSMLALTSCGPRAFVKGEYDEDVESTNLLNDKWSETDMQKAVKDLVASAVSHPAINGAKRPPIVMVTRLQNETNEHIDTQSITDMFQVELMNTGKVVFVDKAAREDIAEEYEYQGSGMVSRETQKGKGGQVGADFIMNGRISTNVQEVGSDKTVYYKITMNLTNLKTGLKVWTGHKQMRKVFKKRRVGL
ncbi:MAG TPA: penicillin-binding protein activator LpoB [Bdellovibrionales bacterium]|nr:penicillin-binding protein activator LpoB [Pseudobdellovibrionaceae bacterium]HAG92116.1 penicillin-binding protein activator LpoB [Bdellovibrionales bacterium]|tara:strand:- start:767 stop:1366 length:600 start_codon:yes stop_codon:yes gene_type:complete